MEREQRLVFGEVAETYDRVRPTYPEAVVDDVLAYACADAARGERALEIGAGTGRATALFASRGLAITALEPSGEMAAVARSNLAPFPDVSVEVSLFEDWTGPGGFRLVFAAQAWHWVPLEIRYVKAHDVLGDGGTLATFWNRPTWDSEPDVRARLDEAYGRFAPDLPTGGPGSNYTNLSTDDDLAIPEIEGSRRFEDVEAHTYAHAHTYPTRDYLALLSTQSDHRLLPDDQRARLFDAVAAVIDGAGGEVTVDYATHLYLARVLA